MDRYRIIGTAIIVAALFAFCGCSANSANVQVMPLSDEGRDTLSGSHSIWGMWQFTADPVGQTLDAVPLRETGFHLNALPFLEPPVNINLTLESFYFTGSTVEADVGLRHPFIGLTEYTGFDVCGVFVAHGSISGFDDASIIMPGPGDTRLLNPDGYSRWWNPAEFPVNAGNVFSYTDGLLGAPNSLADYNCTLDAYKYYCDDLTADAPVSDVTLPKRGMFTAGQKNVRHYSINLDGGLIFNYAVDANWKFPSGAAPWTAPDDFAMDANRAEAWRAEVSEISNTLYWTSTSNGGGLTLSVKLYDWQDPSVNTLKVESPGNFDPVDAVQTGIGVGYASYQVEIINAHPQHDGTIDLLLTAGSGTAGYQGLLPGVPVSAYFRYQTAVSSSEGPVIGNLSYSWDCPGDPCAGKIITAQVTEAYDPGGADVTITWDFDGDFDFADDTDGDDTNLSGTYIYNTPGDYQVYCRVDNGTSYVDAGPMQVSVVECLPDAPQLLNTITLPTSGTGYNIDYADGYAYLTYSNGGGSGNPNGLYIFDVDPPSGAHQVGYVETSHMPQAVAYKDGYCYVAGVYLLGIITIDVDPPESAHIVDTDDAVLANGFVNEAVIYGNYLYFAAQWSALMIYDITDPANPVFQGKTGPTPNFEYCSAVDVDPDKGYAFITWGYETNPEMADYLHVIDISDPTNPTTVLSLDLPHNASNLVLNGDYCYVLENSNMHVFDVTDPPNAYELTSISVMGGLQDISIDGNYAYLVNFSISPWTGNLAVVDISDPATPVILNTMGLSNIAFGIDNSCGIAYAAVGNGFDIIQMY